MAAPAAQLTRRHKRQIAFLIYRDFRGLTRPITLDPATLFSRLLQSQGIVPRHFEQAAQMLSEGDVAENVPCGPDPERHLDAIRESVGAGFDHVYVHQIGADQEGFFRFYENEVLPKL